MSAFPGLALQTNENMKTNTIPRGQARALNDLMLGANYYDKFCHHGTLLNDYENIVGSSHYVRYKSLY